MADTDGLGVEAWDIPFEDLDFGNLIGKGNFGCVWAGEYVGTPVAIKKVEQQGVDKLAPEYVLDKETALKYFLRELSVLKSIHHPNVVQFMGTSMSTDAVFLVTEWVNGGDLRKLIKKKQIPVTWKERAEIARDTAIAMAYLHYKKLIHRDLKPANLLLTENGRVKVCDLGLARTIEATEKGEGKKYYTIAGTDVWMAPEVILGDAYDFKCDVFSFGCVLYCLIKRHSPPPRKPQYGFGFDPEVMLADIPAKCPKEMVEMMKECLETEPEKRPNFRDLAMRLKKLVTELPENDDEEEQKTIEIDGVHVEIESIIKIQEEKVKETTRPPSMEKLPIPRDLPPPVLDEEPPKQQPQPQQPPQQPQPQPVKEEPKTPQHVSKVVTPAQTPTSPTEREALTPRSKEEEEHMALLMSSGGSRYGEEEVRNTRFALLFKAVREKEDKMKNKKDEEEQPQPAATGAPTGKKNDDMRNKRFAALFSMVNDKDL